MLEKMRHVTGHFLVVGVIHLWSRLSFVWTPIYIDLSVWCMYVIYVIFYYFEMSASLIRGLREIYDEFLPIGLNNRYFTTYNNSRPWIDDVDNKLY